ncbi:MAG: hypothetical protein CMC93_00115 [Flavobacteriaceae bacterium]|nr:hypothetical protein [Flavobacteriaceae bacterium]|tara:strand:+ start:1230 stop:1871 length:642 start_codon:yes stop_codon:yes gene_type:complete
MANKIHQQLKQVAKEILDMEEPYDYQKVYDATLLIFERLILIKNNEGFKNGLWEDLESNFGQAIDFIKVNPGKETGANDLNDNEEFPLIMDTIKEIPEGKPIISDLIIENTPKLSFERKKEGAVADKEYQKSLNDKFSKGLNIDRNDRVAFIKNLFDQSPNEFQRAISQIATMESWQEAEKFVKEMIKPDYEHWKDKETYEKRFLKIIENNFK